GAHAPVPAPAADHGREEALAGVTVAEGPVGKDFQADPGIFCLVCNAGDFLKGELPGQHYPREPLSRGPSYAVRVVDGQLGGGMEDEARHNLPGKHSDTGVLDEDRVDTDRPEPYQVLKYPGKLPVVDERVDRNIDPDVMDMGIPDRFFDLFISEVGRIF